MNIVGIVGTNAKHSYNRLLLHDIKRRIAPIQMSVIEIKDVPMFHENRPATDPAIVTDIAAQITAADAVIIGCPEYNHSVPSPLKSLIEWLSYRIHPLQHKPVLIVGASTHAQGSSRAQLHLRQIMDSPGVQANVYPGNEFLLGDVTHAFDDQDQLKDSATIDFLTQLLHDFEDFVAMHQTHQAQKEVGQ